MDAVSPPVNKIQWYEKPLVMPLRDIVKEYREAKYPKKEIDILADLNHTKPCRIAWLLDRCGEVVDKVKLPRKPQKADAPDFALIWRDTPLGAEAAQINAERKHRIMEEKAMRIEEAGNGCPADVGYIPDVTDENAEVFAENSAIADENSAIADEVVKEAALPEGKIVTGRVAVPNTAYPEKVGMEYLITAEFWQIYLAHKFAPLNEHDICRMLKLAEVAREMVE